MTKTLGIVGTGLIGASIGLRARELGMFVLGHDVTDAVQEAKRRGAIDEVAGRDQLYESCNYIAIATPVRTACSELRRLRDVAPTWDLLIDVASVKRPIVEAASGLRNFVATHPLAGNEGSGPARASADLFRERTWAYSPSGDALLDRGFETIARALGANPLPVIAERHDAIVAVTSHLPQLLAFLLSSRIRESGEDARALCGPAGLEILRLGDSSPDLWREIFEANADLVVPSARALCESLTGACDALSPGRAPQRRAPQN